MDYFAIPYSAQMLNTETPFSSFSITDSLSWRPRVLRPTLGLLNDMIQKLFNKNW
jgi:hypothetical protein